MGLSERRACSDVGADRKMARYRSQRPPETELHTRLRALANERRRLGYRRLFILLRREAEASGLNRIYRLYREEGLTVRKRRARRGAVGTRAPILAEAKANARWSLDFVHDQFACRRRFRMLDIVDDATRKCLVAIPDTSISGRRVARELTALIVHRGKPGRIVSDHTIVPRASELIYLACGVTDMRKSIARLAAQAQLAAKAEPDLGARCSALHPETHAVRFARAFSFSGRQSGAVPKTR